MKRSILTFAAALIGLLVALPALAQDKPRKDMVLKGDAACTRCHDETEEYPVLSIGKTKHGTIADGRAPTCTTCHGESDTHANKPADAVERPKVERAFGKTSKTSMEERSAVCLKCHKGNPNRIHWEQSTHAARDNACTSCHQVHTGNDRVRDRTEQAQVCFNCHKDKRAEFRRPSRHPINEGKVVCSNCHNPHGGAGPKQLVEDSVVETCYACHMEKRGPFIWNHQPVTEDCTLCHNPHGTVNPSLLKARSPFLCQECHEPTSHRGTPPDASPVTGSPPSPAINQEVLLGRGCVNCHNNIHGSNSPADTSGSRSFRR